MKYRQVKERLQLLAFMDFRRTSTGYVKYLNFEGQQWHCAVTREEIADMEIADFGRFLQIRYDETRKRMEEANREFAFMEGGGWDE